MSTLGNMDDWRLEALFSPRNSGSHFLPPPEFFSGELQQAIRWRYRCPQGAV